MSAILEANTKREAVDYDPFVGVSIARVVCSGFHLAES